MYFLQPHLLHWLWLGLIPVTLYLFRRKAKRVPVSTLLFFRSLAREHQESAWLRKLKRWLSLLLTLLVIVCAALALARPYREGGGDVPKSLVVVLDRSASMAAVNSAGKSRLEEAKDLLKERLKSLPDNVVASLVVFDAKVDIAQSRSTNRREMVRLVDQVEAVPVEDDPAQALVAAQRLAALDAPAEIWLVSDAPAQDDPLEHADGEKVWLRVMDVGLDKVTNVGITAFQVRPAPLSRNRYEAFVEVSAGLGNSGKVEATLETRLDGRPVQLRQVELAPGESARLILPLEGGKGQRVEMEVKAEGDALGWDNLVLAPLPETRPLVVAWFAKEPDPFTELALSSLLAEERMQVLKGGEEDWPMTDKPDVYVFENWVPEAWPADRPALVLNPPASSGPVLARRLEVAVPHETIRAVQPEHPLLFRVVNARVAITQTAVLNVSDTMETLWMAGSEPVLAAGEANGQRLVITAFQPSKSEQLALLPAFPLLIGNAIYWCAESAQASAGPAVRRTGEVVPVTEGPVTWRAWDGERVKDAVAESKSGWLELDRVGIYESSEGEPATALLASVRETDVPVKKAAAQGGEAGAGEVEKEQWAVGGSWWAVFLWTLLGVLLLESWLFHREAVY